MDVKFHFMSRRMILLAFVIITVGFGVRVVDGEGTTNNTGSTTEMSTTTRKMTQQEKFFFEFQTAEDKFMECADRNYYRRVNETCDWKKLKEFIEKHRNDTDEMKVPYYDVPFSYYREKYTLMCTYLARCSENGTCNCNFASCKELGPRNNEDCEVHFNKAKDMNFVAEIIRNISMTRREKIMKEHRGKVPSEASSNWGFGYHYYLIEIILATFIGTWN